MTKSVIVIGAGPGGLAAAMLLAQMGADVTVIERAGQIGGRSGAIEQDGFRFDIGPTFFLYPQILRDIFATCGRDLEAEVELVRLDPMYRILFEQGGAIDATPDPARMAAELARFAPEDAAALPRFFADNRRKLDLFRPVLQNPFNSVLDLVRPRMLKALPWLRLSRTVDTDLAQYFSDERVRLAFSFQSKYLGMSPFRCPSLFTILSFMEYEYGVFHPRGGCSAVMEAMARVAREMGVKFCLNEPVKEILFDGRRAVGVRTQTGDRRADALVVNADFAQAMAKLVPNRLRRRWKDEKLAAKRYSCSTFMMYLGIEGTIPDLAHHTIFLAEDYRRNIGDIEAGLTPPANPSLYVQNACVTDPGLAPKGCSTLYVLVPVAHEKGHVDWSACQAEYRATVMKRLEKLGIHDIERRIRFEKIMTPAGWQEDLQIYRGATFNLTHSLDQMMHRRPHNRFEDLDAMYLVGGGTHPGSGLPVIFESARISTRLLAEDLGLAYTSWDGSAAKPGEPSIARAMV